MSALTLTDMKALQAGSVFFMKRDSGSTPVRCVVDADGDTVTGRNDLPGSVSFGLAALIRNIEKKGNPGVYANWLFATEQDAIDADNAAIAREASAIRSSDPAALLARLYQHWAHDVDSDEERAAMRDALQNAYGVDVTVR